MSRERQPEHRSATLQKVAEVLAQWIHRHEEDQRHEDLRRPERREERSRG